MRAAATLRSPIRPGSFHSPIRGLRPWRTRWRVAEGLLDGGRGGRRRSLGRQPTRLDGSSGRQPSGRRDARAARGRRRAADALARRRDFGVEGGDESTFILNGFLVAAGPAMAPASLPAAPAALVRVPALGSRAGRSIGSAPSASSIARLTPGWSLKPDSTPVDPTRARRHRRGGGRRHRGTPLDPRRDRDARARFSRSLRLHRRRDRPRQRRLLRSRRRERRRSADRAGMHDHRQSPRQSGVTRLGLHLLVGSRQGRHEPWVSGLVADRKQDGCVRFSFLPIGAVTPRRFECVELGLASPQPLFFSLRYGNPTYAKLISLDAGRDPARRLRRRRDGRLSFRPSGSTRDGPHDQADGIFARRNGIRVDPSIIITGEGRHGVRRQPVHFRPMQGLFRRRHGAGPRPDRCGLE